MPELLQLRSASKSAERSTAPALAEEQQKDDDDVEDHGEQGKEGAGVQGVLASLLAKKLAVAVRPGLSDPPCVARIDLRCNLRDKIEIATDFNSIFSSYILYSRPRYKPSTQYDRKKIEI